MGRCASLKLIPLVGTQAHVSEPLADCDIQEHTRDIVTGLTLDCLCRKLLDSARMEDKFKREVLKIPDFHRGALLA